jgi:hypothetical protein
METESSFEMSYSVRSQGDGQRSKEEEEKIVFTKYFYCFL